MVKKLKEGTCRVVQWSELHASTAGGTGSIPGWGTKVLQDIQCGRKKRKKKTVLQFIYSPISFSLRIPACGLSL